MTEVPFNSPEQFSDPLAFMSPENMQVLEALTANPDQELTDEWAEQMNVFLTSLTEEERDITGHYLRSLTELRDRARIKSQAQDKIPSINDDAEEI